MDKVLNKELYLKVKKDADKVFKRHSAYKSMYIVKKYKELGGKFKGKKESNLKNWRDEKWIQVVPYLENNEIIECGSGKNKKGCRPLIRINEKTPITIKELIKIHGKKKLLELARKKKENMDLRINWKLGKIY